MPLRLHAKDAATIFNKGWRMQRMYKIRTEDRNLRNLDFSVKPEQGNIFKRAQRRAFRGIREIYTKARKLGISTFWEIFYLDDTLFTPNTVSCIIAHTQKDVQKLFKIVKLAYQHVPDVFHMDDGREWHKPKATYDNVNELAFESINSRIYVAIESRGDTNNNLHISEAAHIKKDWERIIGTLESVPKRPYGSNITVESTANGMGGWFHETYSDAESGLNEFDAVFIGWWQDPKNRLPCPKGYSPNEAARKMAERVKTRFGVRLEIEALFWWEEKRKTAKRLMDQEHPSVAEDAFLTSDAMVFEGDSVREINPTDPARIWKKVWIWKEPVPGRDYVMGCDPAEGVGGDSSVIEVYDRVTLEQVAEYSSNTIPPAKFAKTIARVGKHYNEALAAVERNNHGHTVLDRLKDIYSNIFMQTTTDERTKVKTRKMGWLTTGHTRDLMLDAFVEVVEDATVGVNSARLKKEMLTFVTDDDGKRQAKERYHDDTIMASAIAVQVARMPKASFGIYYLG